MCKSQLIFEQKVNLDYVLAAAVYLSEQPKYKSAISFSVTTDNPTHHIASTASPSATASFDQPPKHSNSTVKQNPKSQQWHKTLPTSYDELHTSTKSSPHSTLQISSKRSSVPNRILQALTISTPQSPTVWFTPQFTSAMSFRCSQRSGEFGEAVWI